MNHSVEVLPAHFEAVMFCSEVDPLSKQISSHQVVAVLALDCFDSVSTTLIKAKALIGKFRCEFWKANDRSGDIQWDFVTGDAELTDTGLLIFTNEFSGETSTINVELEQPLSVDVTELF